MPNDPTHWPPLHSMILDSRVQARFKAKKEAYSGLLAEYLKQEGLTHFNKIGIVDCGWRGQIQESISLGLKKLYGKKAPSIVGYYMGTQIEAYHRSTETNRLKPILADIVNFEWMGGAILFCIQLVETLCMAAHATVIGYKNENGTIKPILKNENNETRKIESRQETLVALMQKSTVDYANKYATVIRTFGICSKQTLNQAKYLSCRAIRFPTQREAELFAESINISDQGTENITPLISPIKEKTPKFSGLRLSVQRSLWKAGPIACHRRIKTPFLLYLTIRRLKSLSREICNNKMPERANTTSTTGNMDTFFEKPQYTLLSEIPERIVKHNRPKQDYYNQFTQSHKPYNTLHEKILIYLCHNMVKIHCFFTYKKIGRYSSPQPLIFFIIKIKIRKGLSKLLRGLKRLLKPISTLGL